MMPSIAEINKLSGHAHNPRGNLWFNDESTYGHKLLMKMGWNKGKGLGKNEDGIKENLKVKFRSTNSGLGFKDDAYANVMKTEYESILKNLSAEYSCPRTTSVDKKVVDSDEEYRQKSKIVKSKLRYPKLFFGKDVTKYSEKDMKSIFICSVPLKSIEEKSENTIDVDNKGFEKESPKALDTYSSTLSISDYFAKKMEEKRNNTLNKKSSNSAIHQQTENSETSISTINEDMASKRKGKDSQTKIEKESLNIEELNEVAPETEIVQTENLSLSTKKSSRKRKKEPQIPIEDIEINSSKIESCASDIMKEEVLGNSLYKNISHDGEPGETITNLNSCKPNKKRKISQVFQDDSLETSENTFSSEIKLSIPSTENKKKKKKKHSVTLMSSPENSTCENDHAPTQNEDERNNHLSLDSVQNGLSHNTDSPKKKKKSKRKFKEKLKSCLKNKHGSYSLKNVSFNETVSYRIIDSETESIDSLNCESEGENNELIDSDKNNSVDDTCSEDKLASNEHNSDNNNAIKEEDKDSVESNEGLSLSDLPSSKSSHYNAWIESQRQALKMELYKKMLKSLKKHKILKTTNLLSMKGYGNWGYK